MDHPFQTDVHIDRSTNPTQSLNGSNLPWDSVHESPLGPNIDSSTANTVAIGIHPLAHSPHRLQQYWSDRGSSSPSPMGAVLRRAV